MDERLEKAFQTANYMATLSNLRRVAFEEFKQSLIYYTQGSSFTVSRELMTFVKMLIDQGKPDAIILDDNNIPVRVSNLEIFLTELINIYTKTTNDYIVKYAELKSKRKIEGLVEL